MSYLAKIRTKRAQDITAKTDETPKTSSSDSFVSASQSAFPEKKRGRSDVGRLYEALAASARNLSLTSGDLYEALAPEDIAAWRAGDIGDDNLRAFAFAIHESSEREAGRIPVSYEDIAHCSQCGPVWLFVDGDVPSCPWCINRIAGLPIPRPGAVSCATCRHFRRRDHPHLGRCIAGVRPAAPAGHWDTDPHTCSRWLRPAE